MPITLILRHWKHAKYIVLGVAETANEDGLAEYDSIDAIMNESKYLDSHRWILSGLDELAYEFGEQAVASVYVGSVVAAECIERVGWPYYQLRMALEHALEDEGDGIARRSHTSGIFGRDLIYAVLHLNSTGHLYNPVNPEEGVPSGNCCFCIAENVNKEES